MSSLLPDSLRDPGAPPRALVEALRQEPIEPDRIARAYARFLRQRAAAPVRWTGPRVVRHAALAVLMAVGTVYAGTLIEPLTAELPPTEARPPAEAPKSPPRAVSPRGAIASEKEASQEAERRPEADILPATPPAAREQPVRSPAAAPSAEQWRRAAQGLRDGDYQSANAALKQLTRSGTEADRESALLVQAQVLLAQGREAEAQSLLKSLEASARAPSVRRKSVELLARLRDRPAPRSGAVRGATELP